MLIGTNILRNMPAKIVGLSLIILSSNNSESDMDTAIYDCNGELTITMLDYVKYTCHMCFLKDHKLVL